MPSITLKNIPEDLLSQLREDAEQERRSLNQHALYLIQIALQLKRRRAENLPDKTARGTSFKEFLCRGPLGDVDLPRIEGSERELDL
jgi:hypothetical protein